MLRKARKNLFFEFILSFLLNFTIEWVISDLIIKKYPQERIGEEQVQQLVLEDI